MSKSRNKIELPVDVDEIVALLISDMTIEHRITMANMTDQEFDMLYDYVSPLLLDEFMIWTENPALLESCFSTIESENRNGYEPARVILDRVRTKLYKRYGVITAP
ncbi:MAG: hypothetical protein HKM93_11130 [Desulfobacteraceae bacterium]|nr:hypothetical protein [Desulfobacteraceae bacterium]